MSVHILKMVKFQSPNRRGVIPFRVEAERNAKDISELGGVKSRIGLADSVNEALELYESIAGAAVGQDGTDEDLNSEPGKVGVVDLLQRGEPYRVYAKFTRNELGANQPISEAQVRWQDPKATGPCFEMTKDGVQMENPNHYDQQMKLTPLPNDMIRVETSERVPAYLLA